jgi:hypothetical protein
MMEWMILTLVIIGFGVSLYSNKFRSKAWLIILVMAWVALFADMLTGTFYYLSQNDYPSGGLNGYRQGIS